MLKQLLLLSILLIAHGLSGQVAHYTWDQCSAADNAMLQSDAVMNNITCDCGLADESAQLNGSNSSIELLGTLRNVFDSDFSIEFYFQIKNTNNADIDVLSFSNECSSDSSFFVRYQPSTGTLFATISEDFNARVSFNTQLNTNNCWHHFLLTKTGLEYNLIVDNILVGTEIAPKGLSIANNSRFGFGVSPCLAINEERMEGVIDEFKIYDRAISTLEATKNYLSPGRIVNNDTTVFLGASVDITAGSNCASSIQWTPSNTLSSSNTFATTATPEESTTYTLSTTDNSGCSQSDTVRVYVIQEGDIACDNLLLPKAFTPNGDGLNDEYRISNQFIISRLESFAIYDRWGTKIFETQNLNEGWDGTFEGEAVNPGNFIYQVSYICRENEFNKVGSFTVLR